MTVKVKTANVEMDAVVQAFSGTCAALTAVKCVDAVGVGAEEFLILPNLILTCFSSELLKNDLVRQL